MNQDSFSFLKDFLCKLPNENINFNPHRSLCSFSTEKIKTDSNKSMFVFDVSSEEFIKSIERGDKKKILTICSRNPNVINARNEKGQTMLMVVLIQLKTDMSIFRFILNKGASPCLVDCEVQTTWHYAVSRDNVEAMKLLADHPAADSIVYHCLKRKKQCQSIQSKETQQHQADNNRQQIDAPEMEPLIHMAVRLNKPLTVKFLLQYYPDLISLQDYAGNTIMHYVIEMNDTDMLDMLLSFAKLNDLLVSNKEKRNPVQMTVLNKDLKSLQHIYQSSVGRGIFQMGLGAESETILELAVLQQWSMAVVWLLTQSDAASVLPLQAYRQYGHSALVLLIWKLDVANVGRVLALQPALLNLRDQETLTPLDHVVCLFQYIRDALPQMKEKVVDISIKLIKEADLSRVKDRHGLDQLIKEIFCLKFK